MSLISLVKRSSETEVYAIIFHVVEYNKSLEERAPLQQSSAAGVICWECSFSRSTLTDRKMMLRSSGTKHCHYLAGISIYYMYTASTQLFGSRAMCWCMVHQHANQVIVLRASFFWTMLPSFVSTLSHQGKRGSINGASRLTLFGLSAVFLRI